MRILFVATSFFSLDKFSGGMAKYLHELIMRMKKTHRISLLIPSSFPSKIAGVNIYYYSRPDTMENSLKIWIKSFFSIIFQFLKIMKREKPQIISNFLPNMGMSVIFPLAKVFRAKTIMNFRGYSPFNSEIYRILLNFFNSISYLFTDLFIANSKSFFRLYQSDLLFGRKIYSRKSKRFIPNAINAEIWAPSQNLTKIYDVCFIGNLYSQERIKIKGFQTLNNACQEYLRRYGIKLKILVIGQIDMQILENTIANFDRSYFHFIGPIHGYKNIQIEILKSNLFVLPSNSEGMPNSLLEAMALGIPSISTNVGAVRELIVDGYNGYIIPPNEPSTLAVKINILLSDGQKRLQFSTNSRKTIEKHFSWEHNLAKVIETYEKLLSSSLYLE